MDWEWITGKEGEELDGWFPEPDDPKPSHPIEYDREYQYPSDEDIDWMDKRQSLLEEYVLLYESAEAKLELNSDSYSDEDELQDKIEELRDEIVDLVTFELTKIYTADDIKIITDRCDELGFYDWFLRRDLEEILTECLIDNNATGTLGDAIDECLDRCYFRHNYVLPVLNKMNEKALDQGKSEYTIKLADIEKDIRLLFATKICALRDDKKFQEIMGKLEACEAFHEEADRERFESEVRGYLGSKDQDETASIWSVMQDLRF